MDNIQIPLEQISIDTDSNEAKLDESTELLNFLIQNKEDSIPSDIGAIDIKDISLDENGRIVFSNTKTELLEKLKKNPDILALNIGYCKSNNIVC